MSNSKNSQPLISLIVLNLNSKKITEDCIKSLLKSTYQNFEIIIVDNGSTDDSFDYLKKKFSALKNVKLVKSSRNLFWTGGCNLGAKHAEGQKIFFLNNDIEVRKDALNQLVIFTTNHPKYIVQPKVLNFYNKSVIDNVGGRYKYPGLGAGIGNGEEDRGQYDGNMKRDYVHGMFFIDSHFYKSLGGFDNWYRYHYEDIDLCLRAEKKGGEMWYCADSIVYHKLSQTLRKYVPSDELILNVRKNRLRTIVKNYDGIDRLMRIIFMLGISVVLIFTDFFSRKKKYQFLTIRSIFRNIKL